MTRLVTLLAVSLLLTSLVTPIFAIAEVNEPRDPPPAVIGFLSPMTGPIAVYGDAFTAAAVKAVDDLNAAGGDFTLYVADSGCDGTTAITSAQVFVDVGAVGVAGAACSGASMGANAVLSASGIPQISYASTNPGLSDPTAYPLFFRVVPSDALQGNAISYAFNESGASNPALLHMTNDYGSGLADAFADAWGTDNLCTQIGYPDDQTNFATEVQYISDSGCDSLVMISYSYDGASIVETMENLGLDIPIFGGDGIADLAWAGEFADESLIDGVIATKPSVPTITNATTTFANWCSNDSTCSGGIYTAEAYDAVRLIGEAYLTSQSDGGSLESAIFVTGNHWEGASGEITFMSNGDSGGNGWDICEFAYFSGQASLSCPETWYSTYSNSYSDDDNDGYSDTTEADCGSDANDADSIPVDSDGDHLCDALDNDDDNDGIPDYNDYFPFDGSEWNDYDYDGIGDNADFDDDGDSWADIREEECGYDPMDFNSTPPDLDYDNECDELDPDDDGDMILDHLDAFPMDNSEWSDNDLDGIGDNADEDDDNDYWTDTAENACGTSPTDNYSYPSDNDADEICDIVDDDDDNDGVADTSDAFPFISAEWLDTDSDGIGNNADLDDDADLLSDEIELQMGTDPLNEDTDGDGYYDSIDDLPLDSTEWSDGDGDGFGDNSDAFPMIARYQAVSELFLDLILSGFGIFIVVSLIGGYRFGGGSRDGEDQ